MASSIASILTEVRSAVKALGIFADVQTVEAKSALSGKFTAAVFFASSRVLEIHGSTASSLYVFTLRIYTNMLAEPAGNIDPDLVVAMDKTLDALAGDFDLGATVRSIDFGGTYGTPVGSEAGYIDVNGNMYRIADITIPLIVNDSLTFS